MTNLHSFPTHSNGAVWSPWEKSYKKLHSPQIAKKIRNSTTGKISLRNFVWVEEIFGIFFLSPPLPSCKKHTFTREEEVDLNHFKWNSSLFEAIFMQNQVEYNSYSGVQVFVTNRHERMVRWWHWARGPLGHWYVKPKYPIQLLPKLKRNFKFPYDSLEIFLGYHLTT